MNDSDNASIGQWLLRLFAWDGLLPLSIWSVPIVLNVLFPKRVGFIEFAAVFLPIAAFWIRYVVGIRYIRKNNCGPLMRRFQIVVFCIAIFFLVLLDSLMILLQEFADAPGAAMDVKTFAAIAIPYSIYLMAMAFALYPGFRKRSDTDSKFGLEESTRLNTYGGEEYV